MPPESFSTPQEFAKHVLGEGEWDGAIASSLYLRDSAYWQLPVVPLSKRAGGVISLAVALPNLTDNYTQVRFIECYKNETCYDFFNIRTKELNQGVIENRADRIRTVTISSIIAGGWRVD